MNNIVDIYVLGKLIVVVILVILMSRNLFIDITICGLLMVLYWLRAIRVNSVLGALAIPKLVTIELIIIFMFKMRKLVLDLASNPFNNILDCPLCLRADIICLVLSTPIYLIRQEYISTIKQ